MRNTIPKDVFTIIGDVMEELKTREDSNRYAPGVIRETAMVRAEPMQRLDFEVGNVVQIKPSGGKFVGRVGTIIGIKYQKLSKGTDHLIYSVRFSDREGCAYLSDHLSFVRKTL